MKSKKTLLRYIIVTLQLFSCSLGFGQSTPPSIVGKINISSPNAASIGKFTDIPVSHHTGIPSIAIPLCDLIGGIVPINVSLNYHAGGIRVEETPSWVGLGWALNAGGVITRVVKDKPDEKQTGAAQEAHV